MKPIKNVVGLVAALIPIVYCGGLAYYFVGVPGRVQSSVGLPNGATDGIAKQLGPTVLGLGALGLLFAVPLIIKLIRLTTTPPKRGTAPNAPTNVPVEEEAFDADAALARYLARKVESGEDPHAVSMPEPDRAPQPAVRPTFGRKVA